MLSDMVGAVFAGATIHSKKQFAMWSVIVLLAFGSFYYYTIQPLTTKQNAKVQSMEMVATKFKLEKTLAKLKDAKNDGLINVGEFLDLKYIYKNESFDKNYEMIRANQK